MATDLWRVVALPPRRLGASGCPQAYLCAQPQPRASWSKVHDRSGHVGIPLLIDAHGRPASQAKKASNLLRVDQVIDGDQTTHPAS